MIKVDIMPFIMGSLMMNTLDALVRKRLLTMDEAAGVFVRTSADVRTQAVTPVHMEMAWLIGKLADRYAQSDDATDPVH